MSEADLFAAALKLTDPATRAAFLDQACAGNPELRASLEQLLRAHEQPQPRLDAPSASRAPAEPQALMASTIVPPAETPPQQVGPYRILERIGGGGMGEVFRAEQRTPIRREVALKFIKLGMDTKAVIARFEAERQALALMDHPHIARVLDAGTDDAGRPYFVMEYVKGKPITEYADKQQLTIAERLELVEQVCQAIQHAHHKGVIHRDLKPSNILVSTHDGKPYAKVIDFGIAKAIGQQLTDKTLFTLHEQFVGTPQYMSPEQAEGSLDIDTRTDVYSLGVLLYELLTGTPPFSAKELRQAAWDQFRKQIMEIDPPKPSTRLSESGSDLATLATSRRTEPKRLGTLVRGELDWIVMKALEKDRKRRYETPSSLANDLQAHLQGEPVQAAPPSTAYRVGKFVRRHKGPVFAATAVMFTLLVGVVGTTWQMIRAQRAEQKETQVARQFQGYTDALRQATEQIYAVLWDAKETSQGDRGLPHNGTEVTAWGNYRLEVSKTNGTLQVRSGFVDGPGTPDADRKLLALDQTADPDKSRADLMSFLREQPLGLAEYVRDAQDHLQQARDDAEIRLEELTKSREQSDALFYRSGLQLSYDMLTDGRILEARETLDALPEKLRGWEWRWLKAEVTGPLSDFTLPKDEIFVAHSQTGRYAVARRRAKTEGPFRLFDALTHRLSEPLAFPPYEKCFGVAVSDTGRVAILAVHPYSEENGERSSIYVWDPSTNRTIWTADSGSKTHKYLYTGLPASSSSLVITPDGSRVCAYVLDHRINPELYMQHDRYLTGHHSSWNRNYIYELSDDSPCIESSPFGHHVPRTCSYVVDNWHDNGFMNLRTGKFIPVDLVDTRGYVRAELSMSPHVYNYNTKGLTHLIDIESGRSIARISTPEGVTVLASDREAMLVLLKRGPRLCLKHVATELEIPASYSFTVPQAGYDPESRSFLVFDDLSHRSMIRIPCPSLSELRLLAEVGPDDARETVRGLQTAPYRGYRTLRSGESLQAIGTAPVLDDTCYRSPDANGYCTYTTAPEQEPAQIHYISAGASEPIVSIPVTRDWNVKDIEWGLNEHSAVIFAPKAENQSESIPWAMWVVDLAQPSSSDPFVLKGGQSLSVLGIHHGIVWIHTLDMVRGYRLSDGSEVIHGMTKSAEGAEISPDGTRLVLRVGRTVSIRRLPQLELQSEFELQLEHAWLEWTSCGERLVVASEYPDQSIVCDPANGDILLSLNDYQWKHAANLRNQTSGARVAFRDRWPQIQSAARDEFQPERQLAVAEELVQISGSISTVEDLVKEIVQHPTFTPMDEVIAFRLVSEAEGIFKRLDSQRAWVERLDAEQAIQAYLSNRTDLPAVMRLVQIFPKLWEPPSADTLNDRAWDIVKSPGLTLSVYAKGLRAAEAALLKQPDDANILNTLGVALYRLGKTQEAISALERSEKLAVADGDGIASNPLVIGMAMYRLGDYQGAAQAISGVATSGRELDDEDTKILEEALELLGFAELELGRPTEAIAAWKRIAMVNPENTYLRLRMAAVCAWYELDEDLKELRAEAITMAKNEIMADQVERYVKVCCISDNSDTAQLERARLCLITIIEQAPAHRFANYFHLALGMAEYRLGNYTAALMQWEHLGRSTNGYTDDFNTTVRFYHAMTYAQLGRIDEARTYQMQALAKMRPLPAEGRNPFANNSNADHIICWLASRECAGLLEK